MHEGGRPGARLEHVDDGGQFLEIEFDLIGKVLGFSARGRDAHGDEFANLANFAGGENGLIGRLEAFQAGIGPDRQDTL